MMTASGFCMSGSPDSLPGRPETVYVRGQLRYAFDRVGVDSVMAWKVGRDMYQHQSERQRMEMDSLLNEVRNMVDAVRACQDAGKQRDMKLERSILNEDEEKRKRQSVEVDLSLMTDRRNAWRFGFGCVAVSATVALLIMR